MPKGTLYLVPTGLGGEVAPFLPPATLESLHRLQTFIVEEAKTARAFLKATGYSRPLQSVRMLADAGISVAEREAELDKPFWR